MTPPPASPTAPSPLAPKLQERIYRLWDELATFEAARSEAALMFLLGAVAEMVDAQNAFWMGAVRMTEDERDPLLGWRPSLIRYLQPLPPSHSQPDRFRAVQRGSSDEITMAHARRAGTFRACRMKDLVPADWFKGPLYQAYQARNIHDSLIVGVPVSPMTEAYYGFFRMRANESFTEAQRDVAFYALRGLAWFHRQTLIAHGVHAAGSPLSPVERRVLALLLTDRSEKLIAAELGVTPSTVHTYVRGVLRKLGVSGRTGLISLWLGQRG